MAHAAAKMKRYRPRTGLGITRTPHAGTVAQLRSRARSGHCVRRMHDTKKNSLRALAALMPFIVSSALFACGGGNENLPPPPPHPAAPPVASTSASAASTASSAAPEDAGPPAPKAPDVELKLGAAAPEPPEKASIKIITPTNGQVIAADKADDFEVKFEGKNWKTAADDAHFHFILDNHPYKRIWTGKPIPLKELHPGGPLKEGQHVLVAFPSRASHESVKTPGALTVTEFWVGKKGTPAVDIAKPMLIYSRPKGEYKGDDANHVIVDFYLAHVALAEGKEHVHIKVTGPGIDGAKEADATKWGPPFYLDNLQDGTYVVKLELLDAAGKVLPGPWNSTERPITIDHRAPTDPHHHGGGTTPAMPDAGK